MPKMTAEEKKWRAENDAQILKRALEIQRDPERKRAAQGVIDKELKTLAQITGVKVIKNAPAKKKGVNKNKKRK